MRISSWRLLAIGAAMIGCGSGQSSSSTEQAAGGVAGTKTTTSSAGGTNAMGTTVSSNATGGTNTSGGSSLVGGTGNAQAGTAQAGNTADLNCPGLMNGWCAQANDAATLRARNYLILLDKSGSMSRTAVDSSVVKWSWTVDAFKSALDATDSLTNYGLLLFPFSKAGEVVVCEHETGEAAINIPIQPAAAAVPQIQTLIAATKPSGGTPTAAALTSALNYYTQGAGKALSGFKYVLLVTDGGPNCNADITCPTETCTAYLDHAPGQSACWNGSVPNCCDAAVTSTVGANPPLLCLDDAATIGAIRSLREAGIETYVIGIPGSETYASYLDRFAEAGGMPLVGKAHAYYAITDGTELSNAIAAITQSTIRDCTFPLGKALSSTAMVNLAVDCKAIPQSTGNQVNWTYDAVTQSIAFQGPRCDSMKQAGLGRVDVIEGCATQRN